MTMYEFDIRAFMNMAREIEDQDVRFGAVETLNESDVEFGQVPNAKLSTEELSELQRRVERMSAFADRIGLPTTHALLESRKSELPKTQGEWRILIEAIYSEMKGKLVLYVPPERARFFKLQFDTQTVDAFPFASKEMQLAGRCLSAGMFTASVFHSMRAGEIGVRSLSDDLGVTFTYPADQAAWQNHQDQISMKIGAMKQQPKSDKRDKDLLFYSQAAAQLQYFNDGWRVRVAHARASYDEGDAISVLSHAVALINVLATRVKEPIA
jgi:hypothetical protein